MAHNPIYRNQGCGYRTTGKNSSSLYAAIDKSDQHFAERD